MTGLSDRDDTVVASEIPGKHLPPVTYRPMPEAPRFRRIMGPGVILLAGAVGSGEFVLWPFIASKEGLGLLWAALIGVFLQYFINTEVQRYTLATGETAITGFTRLWRPWGLLFATFPLIGFVFPGIAVSAATSLTYATGGSVLLVAIGILFLIGIALSVSPVIYQTLEKFQTVAIVAIFLFLLVATVIATSLSDWGEAAKGLVSFGNMPSTIAPAVFVSALVYAGSGGLGNLTLSNWIRDKNWGMGSYIPRLVSPITGVEAAAPSIGHFFPQDEANLGRFRRWWKLARREQIWLFLVLGTVSIVALSVLTYATVGGKALPEGDLAFIRAQGSALQSSIGPWFGIAFWCAGFVILFSTTVGNIDIAGRVVGDVLKVDLLRKSGFWSESKVYLATVWAQILIGALILLLGLQAPLVLLSVSGIVGGLVLFASTTLLIRLNRRLPGAIRVGGLRLVLMTVAAAFYGSFAVFVIYDTVQGWAA